MTTFEMLYDEYYDRVYAFLYRLCADRSLTEDLLQETFLQAYVSFHRFRGECEVFTWLASIAKHVYFKYLKRNRLHLDSVNLDVVVSTYCMETVDPEEIYHREYVKKVVRDMVRKIPKKYRDVVLLRMYAELPFSQIALALKISENSAKVIFFRAKKKMMEVLRNEFEL
ncbi:sigma-70 family RNA polymerase sigma factor [Anaerotignum lactatifermentans]|uniref:RNA polymerase sigma factor n=1 Tax=Anaerotignum lactatifermentans TaxID=160404 RepID=A0ABS2G6W6_9FIRM|nr:sigma-70 family RNA polymerase sigma factor [Anaerotignum lactatifermentans]MBM6828057.1 sigma-70 family RNA polymerase sigma factor [Anaerotignum lactatifermentans]MBM6876780.1 sigma-70 family RNA polymerase sigma factor [Anaerotignum lactatifermentans]MBM6949640.1 sigma-70 family RNA polymerase sigma factor [Anaerotignum lactatifermentans]